MSKILSRALFCCVACGRAARLRYSSAQTRLLLFHYSHALACTRLSRSLVQFATLTLAFIVIGAVLARVTVAFVAKQILCAWRAASQQRFAERPTSERSQNFAHALSLSLKALSRIWHCSRRLRWRLRYASSSNAVSPPARAAFSPLFLSPTRCLSSSRAAASAAFSIPAAYDTSSMFRPTLSEFCAGVRSCCSLERDLAHDFTFSPRRRPISLQSANVTSVREL